MPGPKPWLDHYPEGVDWHAPVPVGPLHSLLDEAARDHGARPAWDFLGARATWAEAAERRPAHRRRAAAAWG